MLHYSCHGDIMVCVFVGFCNSKLFAEHSQLYLSTFFVVKNTQMFHKFLYISFAVNVDNVIGLVPQKLIDDEYSSLAPIYEKVEIVSSSIII